MAGREKHAYQLFTPVTGSESEPTGVGSDEFDEADVWGCALQPCTAEQRKPGPAARSGRKKTEDCDRVTAAPASLPVNIPDWSKILGEEYRSNRRGLADDSDDERVGSGPMIPPHELLWRNRGASFSGHGGMDRTHKGRDMNRLRNAVWEKFGFQD